MSYDWNKKISKTRDKNLKRQRYKKLSSYYEDLAMSIMARLWKIFFVVVFLIVLYAVYLSLTGPAEFGFH